MKKFISFILAIAVLSNFVVLVSAEKESGVTEGDIIEIGSYPQTRVTDENLIAALDAATPENSGSFEDYYGRVTVGYKTNDLFYENKHMMHFRDVVYENERYRGVSITWYRPRFTYADCSDDSNQKLNGYLRNQGNYWFKYEPLEWMVFDGEQGLALCTKVIDSQPYNNEYSEEDIGVYTVYWNGQIKCANNLSTSYLFNWLNDDFYNIAFSETEKSELIQFDTITEPIDGAVGENRVAAVGSFVSLLTYNQAYKDEIPGVWVEVKDEFKYTTDDTKILCTDYAKAQGLETTSGVEWWLATPSDTTLHNYTVRPSKPYEGPETKYQGSMQPTYLSNSAIVVNTSVGVRPVICLENVLAQQEEEEKKPNKNGWFSKDDEDTTPVIAEGECNSKIDWSLSEDGVLTITGKGKMPEWNDSASSMPPWYYDNRSDIKSVIVDGKITSIGKLAFYGCENLESVTIPKSVKYIGECAFDECNSLKEINYGSNAEDWAKIEVDEDNIDLSQITVNYSENSGFNWIGGILIGGTIGGAVLVSGAAVTTLVVLKKKKKV